MPIFFKPFKNFFYKHVTHGSFCGGGRPVHFHDPLVQSSPGPDDEAAAVGRNISKKASEVGRVEVSSTRMLHILACL